MDFLLKRFEESKDRTAFIYRDEKYSYSHVLEKIKSYNIYSNKVIILIGANSVDNIIQFLSLVQNNIVIPLTTRNENQIKESILICKPDLVIDNYSNEIKELTFDDKPDLYLNIQKKNKSGLVLFSSGTTGKRKAVLHDFKKLIQKFITKRKNHSTLAFMFIDHIGGIDTLFYALSNTSTIALIDDRTPKNICRIISKNKIEVLPTTPSFLNLLLISEDWKNYDLSSIKYITYGTEPISESTLSQINKAFPKAEFLQKFGTTEVGTLRSKSLSKESVWVKLGGEGFETRIVDGKLEIKAESAMMGYLNEESPFTNDGWYKTGDLVLEKNGYYKILGREKEIINVGGEKVNPVEVENILLKSNFVDDIVISSEKNFLMGNIVVADVYSKSNLSDEELIKHIKLFAKDNLENYKIPVKIKIIRDFKINERFKKQRLKNNL